VKGGPKTRWREGEFADISNMWQGFLEATNFAAWLDYLVLPKPHVLLLWIMDEISLMKFGWSWMNEIQFQIMFYYHLHFILKFHGIYQGNFSHSSIEILQWYFVDVHPWKYAGILMEWNMYGLYLVHEMKLLMIFPRWIVFHLKRSWSFIHRSPSIHPKT